MITTTIREQLVALAPIRATTPSDVSAPEEVDPAPVVPTPKAPKSLNALLQPQPGDVPPQWLALLQCLQKELKDVQYQLMRHPLRSTMASLSLKGDADITINCKTPTITNTKALWIPKNTCCVLKMPHSYIDTPTRLSVEFLSLP
ncbi:UNVERIFIED_CONTAM: hypothetical protein Slati_1135700 [Sesamum latifolium]|uniref:Uncharacterized protein n=1 Tax=Sesamum latifolium TaxID=2727402 RepID=A0AAW2XFB8_9LAMI